tara:strand:+ start:178 stop:870 length:693 start_codon:yes stop_codon:yes gene_type:complete
MNLEFLENLNSNNVLITKKNIYRKYPSLINKYDLYILNKLYERYVWEKTNIYNDLQLNSNFEVININDIKYLPEDNSLIFYKYDNNLKKFTHTLTYDQEYKYDLLWNPLPIYMDSEILNNISLKSLDDIPSHIDLTKEDDLYTYDVCDTIIDNIPIKEEIKDNEKRLDPFDNEYYTKDEFNNYYGDLFVWKHQDPGKVLKREYLDDIIERYSHLSDEKFSLIFNKFYELV